MKKFGCLLLMATLLLTGCSQSGSGQGGSASLVGYVVEKVEMYNSEGDLTSTTEYVFNDAGVRTGGVVKDKDGKETQKIECTLDDQGKITKIEYIDLSNQKTVRIKMYDSQGNLTEDQTISDYGEKTIYKYGYDEKGQWISTENYYDETLMSKDEMTYDDQGHRVSTKSYDADQKLTSENTQYTYDDHENITSFHVVNYFNGDTQNEYDMKFKYEYDNDLLVLSSLDDGHEAREYKYDEHGKVIEFHHKALVDGDDYYSTKTSYKTVNVKSEEDKAYCEAFQ